MKIGFIKPDYGITGGFEIVLNRLQRLLEDKGHTVKRLSVPAPTQPLSCFDLDIPDRVSNAAYEFFRHMSMLGEFAQLDTSGVDVVVSTQPPSYAVDHPKHLSLFYHHLRIFYDLSDLYVAAGFALRYDHLAAQSALRPIDESLLKRTTWFLAPPAVKKRLSHFNGLSNVGEFNAGSGLGERTLEDSAPLGFEFPLLVGRHEFPKRSELFVHAMKYLPEVNGIAIGGGGRLDWARELDARLSAPGFDLDAVTEKELWICPGISMGAPIDHASNLSFLDHLEEEELAEHYRRALCIVAPAYQEDYGLTAVEAMSFAKPCIVCSDGGGLVEIVEHGVNGLVVEPTGRAIADAIRMFDQDRSMARELGQNGREMLSEYTWSQASDRFHEAIERVAG